MSYRKVNWINELTPLNADNLNIMDEAIADIDERMTDAERHLRIASPTQLGIVRPDGVTVKTSASGVLTAVNGGGGGASVATQVSYDDSLTHLGADNVQNALEKVTDKTTKAISDIEDTIEENADWLKSKNLTDEKLIQGTYKFADGTWVTTGVNVCSKNKVKVNPHTEYSISYIGNEVDLEGILFYKADGTFISYVRTTPFTTPTECEYINYEFKRMSGLSPHEVTKIQIEKGPTVTPYQPIYKSNLELTQSVDYAYDNGFVSRNLLPYPFIVTDNAPNGTYSGVTYKDNGNGSITLNGTSTSTNYVRLNVGSGIFGTVSGSSISGRGQIEVGEYKVIFTETTDDRVDVLYDPSRDLLAITANGSGKTFNNETFYPRVVKKSLADKSYTPYALSNVELTEKVSKGLEPTVSQITLVSGSSADATNCKIVDFGSYCMVILSRVSVSNGNIVMNLPRPALVTTKCQVPYNSYSMAVVGVEENSTELKMFDYALSNANLSILIPLKNS